MVSLILLLFVTLDSFVASLGIGNPGESFAYQQDQEAVTSLGNQVYNPLNIAGNGMKQRGRFRRSPTGKFLIIKGEIKDDSNDDDALRILDRLFPHNERVIVEQQPVLPPPPPYFHPPPFLGAPILPFASRYQPSLPDVSSVMVGPVYPNDYAMPEPDYYQGGPEVGQALMSPPFIAPAPPSPLPPPRSSSKYFVDDTISEGAFNPYPTDRFKGISRGGVFSVQPRVGAGKENGKPGTKKIKIGYIPAGRTQKDKGRLKGSQQFKMMEFVPEPEPPGCHCPNGNLQQNGMFFKSWPTRSKRCVKRCAYHDMMKKLKKEKAENNISM